MYPFWSNHGNHPPNFRDFLSFRDSLPPLPLSHGAPDLCTTSGPRGAPHLFGMALDILQGGAPTSYVCWFINHSKYRYNTLINPSEMGLMNQLNAIFGAPHCLFFFTNEGFDIVCFHKPTLSNIDC